MRLLFAIMFAGTCLWAGAGHAEMAIAIGATGDVYKDGFVWGGGFDEGGRQTALDICRGIRAPEVGKLPDNVPKAKKLCKIVAVFRDKCFAMAHDGSTTKPATGFGWSVEEDLAGAESIALDKCRVEAAPSRRSLCKIEYSHCDGSAK